MKVWREKQIRNREVVSCSFLRDYIEQSEEVTFLSDGERRYGNQLFDFCAEVLRDGRQGHPPKVLPPNIFA